MRPVGGQRVTTSVRAGDLHREQSVDHGEAHAVAAVGWLLAFLPWVLRSAGIYLRPRIDGRPG